MLFLDSRDSHPILPFICKWSWLFTSPAVRRRNTLLLTSVDNELTPLAMRTDSFFHYLILFLECLDRWQIYLSHINPQASTTEQVTKLNKTPVFEIPHVKSPHRCNLDLSEGMGFAITFNTWKLSFRENHFLPAASTNICTPYNWYRLVRCSFLLLGVAPLQNKCPTQSLPDLPW